MNVNTVSSTSSIYDSSQTSGAQSANGTPAVSCDVSGIGSLMSQLEQLSQTDPAKFKQVTAEISDKLKTEAGQATGQQAQFLSQLSDKFAQASQAGNMSRLEPPKHAGGHHHGAHHAHAASQSQGSTPDSVESIIESALQDVSATTSTAT
jgi:hypothetical protein